VTAATVGRVP